ncbi:hypothetical protein [Thermomonas sp. HDW16]|uniref:hypothetical protein n=1 Tax=Thermomonas sp. HDW16 TaxID=2714945 RepID=UPI00140DC765|nr:hypothetical protein [Thermomonas sp. HDW16]QIL19754.1 hypothetical protein G7079_02870 [Thermomonas sp. HDW16]
MNSSLSSALIYLLGFVGLASIGLIPLRVWQVLRRALAFKKSRLLIVFLALIAAMALLGDAQITTRIFKCLTESYCGPGVASGWIYLAMLGVVYLVFEVSVLLIWKINRAKPFPPAA